ncbi:aminotransferase class I/II-fold pyridoxal phosphate-dependent enzyme [bacterium]|jgi:CDP-6-deoxy-D-xylo-4-hexulose-3-dehydrase|nr:aminotransferase class I/II-fold pyridoxal phosphate-dependent enzyme [Gammaproteobacteria bacterium]MDB0028552.1 aminotransferase class I/II-fold pyridoxal phosphate-dependent enzyme [bacterium]
MSQNSEIRVPYGLSVHGEEEIEAVVEVLRTSTQMSKNVLAFEDAIAKLFAKDYGVMVNSGSSALYILIEALNLPKGSEVITPALTFATTVGCLVKNDLKPHFVDVGLDTYCVDLDQVAKAINPNTSAIIAPDLMGNICDWKGIQELAQKHDLKVICDSADTLGSKLHGKSTGSYCDAAITSFYGSHVINGAGNGGMLLTNDEKVSSHSKLLRSWGRSSSLFSDSEAIENRFNVALDGITYDAKFIFEEIGYQLEPSEISAAFANVQLKKLDFNMQQRQSNFAKHCNFFEQYNNYFILPNENPNAETAWLAYPLIIKEDAPFTRTEMQIYLEKRNIQTRVVFTGNILRQPGYKDIDCVGSANDFVNADNVMRGGILLALHHGVTEEMMSHVHDSCREFISSYS